MLLLLTACTLWDDSPYRDNVLRLTDADDDGVTLAEGDCNDADPGVYPGAVDVCDGDDNDCDGETDEIPPDTVWCQDVDGDGFGDVRYQTRTCYPTSGWVMDCTDCDDAAPLVHPEATEACNGYDDNCDGVIDPDGAAGSTTWYVDRDGDGYGGVEVYAVSCEAPPGATDDQSDCDDAWALTNPGAPEECGDGRDNDCDGTRNQCGWSGEKVLDTTMAAFIAGPAVADENLGISIGIVDTNADGVDDIVLAGLGEETAPASGVIHVWAGAPTGSRTIDQASGHLRGVTDLYLGFSNESPPLLPVEAGGDDLLVAASGFAAEFDEDGAICRIPAGVYGDAPLDPSTIFARGASYWEGYGEGFVRADSMTEGVPSLLVAAPYNEEVTERNGAIYLVHLDLPDGQDAIGRLLGTQPQDYLGGSGMALADDLDGDGVGDLVVGAGSRETPAVFVIRGPLIGEAVIDDAELVIEAADLKPDSTVVAPDVNDDGYADVVTAMTDRIVLLDGHGTGRGEAHDLQLGYLLDTRIEVFRFQYGMAVGDVHSDGIPDLAVGSPNISWEGKDGVVDEAGAIAIVPLTESFAGGADLWDSADAIFVAPEPSALGYRVAIGDVNADGFDDLLAGAVGWAGHGLRDSGGAWFVLGGGI